MQVSRILVPTDLSDFGALALRYADELAAMFGARITVMHAIEPPFATVPADIPIGELPSPEATRKEAMAELEAFVVHHGRNPGAIDVMAVESYPTPAILEAARDIKASLIVLGTHGRRGWRRALLGSVTERVLRESTIPVLTVAPLVQSAQEPRFKLILCPVNFSTVGQMALREAGRLAGAAGAELIVLHVSEGKHPPAVDSVERQLDERIAPDVRGRCRYSQIITHGDAAQRVLDIAEEMRADLLVIGAQHRLFADGTVIGRTSERIVRFARVPVLTVARDGVEAAKEQPAELTGAIS